MDTVTAAERTPVNEPLYAKTRPKGRAMYRKRIAIGALLLAVVLVALGFAWPWRSWWRSSETLRLPGVVEIQEVRLGSKIGGRVERVEVMEGDLAQAGQTLVVFEAPQLRAQRQQFAAQVATLEAEYQKAKEGPRPEEKQAAKAAMEAAAARLKRLQTGYRQEEISQARSDLESARADLKLAQEKLERARDLYARRTMSLEDYEVARGTRDRCQGIVKKAQFYLDMLLTGSRPEDIEEGNAQLKQAQANYDLLLAGTRLEDIAAAKARLEEARGRLAEIDANLEEALVQAPERVLVEVVSVRKGDIIAPNQPILKVLRADDLWVKIYVPETQLGQLRLNDNVEVTLDSYPDRRFAGTVMLIAAESEFTPRNVQSADERRHQVFGVKVRVPNPEGIFKSGMAAEVIVPLR
jgi:multidrug resistance efflux pump